MAPDDDTKKVPPGFPTPGDPGWPQVPPEISPPPGSPGGEPEIPMPPDQPNPRKG